MFKPVNSHFPKDHSKPSKGPSQVARIYPFLLILKKGSLRVQLSIQAYIHLDIRIRFKG